MSIKILVVKDNHEERQHVKKILEDAGYLVNCNSDGEDAIETLKQEPVDIVITELKLPDMNGINLIRKGREVCAGALYIILTSHNCIKTAVEAVKSGAFHYLLKPYKKEELLLDIKTAVDFIKLKKENLALHKQIEKTYSFENIIGKSEPMQTVYELIEKVADSDSTTLILGESGTGKELIAKTIHYNSPRKDMPFIPVNCGAIPEDLLESELFGHEKGSFTGAIAARIGRFEMAHKGTIFLDEIGDMSPSLQVKILRVLQEREFERVGGAKTIKVDVRVIAATNQDLEQAMEEKKFRKDLYYRLNVIPIILPPLRERRDDIPLLIDHFLNLFIKKKKKQIDGISTDAFNALINHDWPGNVRELENMMERLIILKGKGTIAIKDLPEKVLKSGNVKALPLSSSIIDIPEGGIDFNNLTDSFERELIKRAIEKSGGVKNKAAQLLGINRTTLIEKMKKKGMVI
ncbi:MAG: sigma-54-dependent Fis family transcriptional regulator [Deltaproteobacteria bacterium]|nr:sigma-54-dependent Fis family transcriptional regulator [Deltaproteobacteria bacterium]